MSNPWENDDCADVRSYHTHYQIPVAAALWCGVPAHQVEGILRQCTEVGRAILAHPKIPCIEPRCRAMHEAINAGLVEYRRDGKPVADGEHVAPERRTISRIALKAWIAEQFPSSKPEFLFDAVERTTHSAINADSYRALQAERDALKSRLEKAAETFRDLKRDRDNLEHERDSLAAMVQKQSPPGERAETTYLNIIGAMLDVIMRTSPGGQPYSVFTSQSAVIQALLGHHEGKAGISARTLEEKFPAARKSLGA